MFYYTAFGFNIASELEFPELFISKKHIDVDVHIKMGIAPKFLEDGVTTNPELWVTPDRYLIHFKEVAWYYAENGNLIIIDPFENADAKSPPSWKVEFFHFVNEFDGTIRRAYDDIGIRWNRSFRIAEKGKDKSPKK